MKVFGIDTKQHKPAKPAVLFAAQMKHAAKPKSVMGVLGDS